MGLSLVLLAPFAEAKVTRVPTRAALAANAEMRWQAFGQDGSALSTPETRRRGALTVTIGSSSGILFVRREGTSWHGDFKPGQFLLAEAYPSDNFILSFSPPIIGLGARIDPGAQAGGGPPYTGRFRARMCLFSPSGRFLGEVEKSGNATVAEDGSASFLGARSDGVRIGYVLLWVSGLTKGFAQEGDLAIDRLGVVLPDAKTADAARSVEPLSGETPADCR